MPRRSTLALVRPAMPARARRAMLGTAVCACVVAACSGAHGQRLAVGAPSGPRSASPAPTPAPASVRAPATPPPIGPPGHYSGLPTRPGSPALAIKIENTVAGRPQAGVSAADLVYVEQVEGGLTRLLAIYNSRLPALIGPVRSARADNVELLAQYGKVAFAYSGAQPAVLSVVANSSLVDVGYDDVSAAYTKLAGRYAPENLFVDPGRLLALKRGVGAIDTGLRFSPAAPAEGMAAAGVAVGYPAASFAFDYDPPSRSYRITQDGTVLHGADSKLESTKNVIVQDITQVASGQVDVLGNATPANVSTGSGTATLYRDGRAITLRWSRGSDAAATRYSYAGDGRRMVLHPGSTWILLLPPDGSTSNR